MQISAIANEGKVVDLDEKRLRDAGIDPAEMAKYDKAGKKAAEEERKKYQKESEQGSGLSSKEIEAAYFNGQDGDAWLYRWFNRDDLRYDHAAGLWYIWRGHYWEPDKVDEALLKFDEIIDAYGREAQRESDLSTTASREGMKEASEQREKKAKQFRERMLALHNVQRKTSVLKLAGAGTGDGFLGLKGDEWERDPWVLGCLNGVIDLKTGELRAGKQDDYIQKICPTPYEGLDCPAPTWERFLFEIFDGKKELVDYIQRMFGYSITGLRQEHFIPILFGRGRNGKGTCLETLKEVLGELAEPVPSELLVGQDKFRSSSAASPEIYGLRGRRITWASETEDGGKFNAGRVKWLTGGDTITARRLYGDMVSFEPTHTIFLLTNHKPMVTGDDDALWERIHLIPFPFQYVPDPVEAHQKKADKTLPDKLKAEASGMLAWLVRGCLEWQKHGLNPPAMVKAATQKYRSNEDILGQFLSERCVIDSDAMIQSSVFHRAYKSWCDTTLNNALGIRSFGDAMERKGFNKEKSKRDGCMYFFGVQLKHVDMLLEPEPPDPPDID